MKISALFLSIIATTILLVGCIPLAVTLSREDRINMFSRAGINIENGIGRYNTKIDGEKKDISPNSFFILIEEKANDVWTINKILKEPIARESLQQEILYVKNIDSPHPSVETYYEDYKTALLRASGVPDAHMFDCRAKNQNKPSYNPCNSKLTTVYRGDYRLIAGDKIFKIVKQTDIIAKVREIARLEREECLRVQSIASKFINKIIVEPQITDKSGFYKGEKIVNISKAISGRLTCPIDLGNVNYSVSMNISGGFTANIEPKHYRVKYNAEGYFLKPTVTITGKTFKDIFPKYINEDNSLRIEFDGKKIRFINKTNNFLQIKAIAIYYNEEVSNFTFGDNKALKLPPQASTKEPLLIKSYTTSDVIKMSKYSSITKDFAMQQNISFGFAIKYRLVGEDIDKTLYKQNKYNLYKIVSGL